MPKNLTPQAETARVRKASKMPSEAKIKVRSVTPKRVPGKRSMPSRTNSNKTY